MDWPSLKILLPAVVLAALVFVISLHKGFAAIRAFLAALVVGLAAYWALGRLPAVLQEAIFLVGSATLVGLLARTYISRGKDHYARNIRWFLTLIMTIALILTIDGWLFR